MKVRYVLLFGLGCTIFGIMLGYQWVSGNALRAVQDNNHRAGTPSEVEYLRALAVVRDREDAARKAATQPSR